MWFGHDNFKVNNLKGNDQELIQSYTTSHPQTKRKKKHTQINERSQ